MNDPHDEETNKASATGGSHSSKKLRYPSIFQGQPLERLEDFRVECTVRGFEDTFVLARQNELHLSDLDANILQLSVNGAPGNLVVPGRFAHDLLCGLMVGHDAPHHADHLCNGAQEIVLRETVLLQEIFSDDLRDPPH